MHPLPLLLTSKQYSPLRLRLEGLRSLSLFPFCYKIKQIRRSLTAILVNPSNDGIDPALTISITDSLVIKSRN